MLRDLGRSKADLRAADFFLGVQVQKFLGPAWLGSLQPGGTDERAGEESSTFSCLLLPEKGNE